MPVTARQYLPLSEANISPGESGGRPRFRPSVCRLGKSRPNGRWLGEPRPTNGAYVYRRARKRWKTVVTLTQMGGRPDGLGPPAHFS
jgi:hypothetical protein